jgi:uncharacterized protein
MLLWVGTSAIAGRGLYTAKAITRGRRIIQYTGEKITKTESDKRLAEGNVYIFALNERYDIDAKAQRHQARYINHSCDPNCHVEKTSRTIWIVASRDIRAGEELTYNYGFELTDALPHPCTCGAQDYRLFHVVISARVGADFPMISCESDLFSVVCKPTSLGDRPLSHHCEGAGTPDTMVCALVHGSQRRAGRDDMAKSR